MNKNHISKLVALLAIPLPVISGDCIENKSGEIVPRKDETIIREIKYEEPVTVKLIKESPQYIWSKNNYRLELYDSKGELQIYFESREGKVMIAHGENKIRTIRK